MTGFTTVAEIRERGGASLTEWLLVHATNLQFTIGHTWTDDLLPLCLLVGQYKADHKKSFAIYGRGWGVGATRNVRLQ